MFSKEKTIKQKALVKFDTKIEVMDSIIWIWIYYYMHLHRLCQSVVICSVCVNYLENVNWPYLLGWGDVGRQFCMSLAFLHISWTRGTQQLLLKTNF